MRCWDEVEWQRYLDEDWDEGAMAAAKVHLEGCPRCQGTLEGLIEEEEVLRRSFQPIELPPQLAAAVQKAVAARIASESWKDRFLPLLSLIPLAGLFSLLEGEGTSWFSLSLWDFAPVLTWIYGLYGYQEALLLDGWALAIGAMLLAAIQRYGRFSDHFDKELTSR